MSIHIVSPNGDWTTAGILFASVGILALLIVIRATVALIKD